MEVNAHASTSAPAPPPQPTDVAAPTTAATAFGSEDYIAFDFGHDNTRADHPQHSTAANGADADANDSQPAQHPRSGAKPTNTTAPPSSSASRQVAGKKRKIDQRHDDAKTKQERKEARSRYTPWSADVDWHRCRNAAEMLHCELMAFDTWLAPTYAEHETRIMVIDLIARAIKGRWSNAQVYSFGSQETRLYLPQGDIDLVVVSDTIDYQPREAVLRAMAATLRQHNLATEVQVIARAKVPIVKFVCTYARLRVDISVNEVNGLSAAKYVNSWLRKQPSMRPLVMAVKHLLVQRGMSEVFSGGLGSYSVIILVISFLQLHPKVQRGEIDPARNLGVLFLEFLELYGKNFGYDNCGISIRGKGGYFSKARRGWKDERRPFMLCLEDPHDPTNDISRGSYGILNIRAVFAGAFDIVTGAICQKGSGAADRAAAASAKKPKHHMFGADSDEEEDEDALARRLLLEESRGGGVSNPDDKDPNSLLGTIVGVSKVMMKQRREMEDLYHSGALQNRLGRPPPLSSPPPADRYVRAPPQPPANAPRGPKGKAQREKEKEREREREREAQQLGPSPKKIKGQAQKLAREAAASSSHRGNASDPISFSSSPERDVAPPTLSIRGAAADNRQVNGRGPAKGGAGSSSGRASRSSSPEIVDEAELAASQGFSFSSGSNSNPSQNRGEALMGISRDASQTHLHANGMIEILSGSEEEDSRYNAPRAKRWKMAHGEDTMLDDRAADLEKLSKTAPSTFVDDSSDDAASLVGDARGTPQRNGKGKGKGRGKSQDGTSTPAPGETSEGGPRRSRRLSAQSSSTSPVKHTPGLEKVDETISGTTSSTPAARSPKKLTNRARRDFWTAKGAVSPKEREGYVDEQQ